MPRRRLPPHVLDIAAPQYPLPEASRSARACAPLPGRNDDDDDHITTDLHHHHHVGGRGARLRATPSERRLARWLAGHLSFGNALPFVVRHGATTVANILHWEGVVSPRVEGGWDVNSRFHTPGGFLRRAVERWAPTAMPSPTALEFRRQRDLAEGGRLTGASRNGYHVEAAPVTEPRRLAIGGK